MPSSSFLFLSAILMSSGASAAGPDLRRAPPAFDFAGGRAVPVDFASLHVEYAFDAAAGTAVARARVEFSTAEAGSPIIDLRPAATALRLDGVAVAPAEYREISDPQNQTTLRVIATRLAPGGHVAEITYAIPANRYSFSNGAVHMLFEMDDVWGGGFLENYAPANLEFDQFPTTFRVSVAGAPASQQVFTNGEVVARGAGELEIRFPAYFTSSSHYLHLSSGHPVETGAFAGVGGPVPITIYAPSGGGSALAQRGLAEALVHLKTLEDMYGAFPHPTLVAYVTGEGGGGMEYSGATVTSLKAFRHELAHSWFARGVMPDSGNSGWIDETIALWSDSLQPASAELPLMDANMANFPPYTRKTALWAYVDGESLLRNFQSRFDLKGALRELARTRMRTVINSEELRTHLELFAGASLLPEFDRYVYGGAPRSAMGHPRAQAMEWAVPSSPAMAIHRPWTPEERLRYR